jgi:hypothetical protein
LEAGELVLNLIEDSCSFGLRGQNLSNQSWLACLSLSQTAKPASPEDDPPGCAESPVIPVQEAPADLPVEVSVHSGDSRHFVQPPDEFALANSENIGPPPGIQVSYDAESVGFGTTRLLWWGGDWIEATTELGFTAMGVQFWALHMWEGLECSSTEWKYGADSPPASGSSSFNMAATLRFRGSILGYTRSERRASGLTITH